LIDRLTYWFICENQGCVDYPISLRFDSLLFLTVLIIVYSYSSAAKCYAQTQVSFEEVALKFIQVEERQALRMFLLKKLDSLKNQVRTSVIYLTTSSSSFYSRIEDRAKYMHPYGR